MTKTLPADAGQVQPESAAARPDHKAAELYFRFSLQLVGFTR